MHFFALFSALVSQDRKPMSPSRSGGSTRARITIGIERNYISQRIYWPTVNIRIIIFYLSLFFDYLIGLSFDYLILLLLGESSSDKFSMDSIEINLQSWSKSKSTFVKSSESATFCKVELTPSNWRKKNSLYEDDNYKDLVIVTYHSY